MTLLERTAEALYLTWTADHADPEPWSSLPPFKRAGYERLAVTALTIAYREPVTL